MAQWLRLHGSTAGGTGLIPGQGSSTWCGKKKKVHQSSARIINSHLSPISGEDNGNPFQYSCLENPMDGGAW